MLPCMPRLLRKQRKSDQTAYHLMKTVDKMMDQARYFGSVFSIDHNSTSDHLIVHVTDTTEDALTSSPKQREARIDELAAILEVTLGKRLKWKDGACYYADSEPDCIHGRCYDRGHIVPSSALSSEGI